MTSWVNRTRVLLVAERSRDYYPGDIDNLVLTKG